MENAAKPHGRRTWCKLLCSGTATAAIAAAQAHGTMLDKLIGGSSGRTAQKKSASAGSGKRAVEARYYTVQSDHVECGLCPNRCKLGPGLRSRCLVRENVNEKLYTLVYGNPAAIHVDPVEKKPLYHFYPGSTTFSIGFAGCNFQCLNCQNWELSQSRPEKLRTYLLFPAEAVQAALTNRCHSIAYTYNEPGVVFEYLVDTAALAREAGIKNIWVSNGYLNREPLEELCNVIDAANVDLKSFSEKTYQKLNAGKLQPVLDTLILLKKRNVWLEITNLMVPGYSDDIGMVKEMCQWIKSALGADCPLHISRFHPQYKLQHLAPTPPSVLIAAREAALAQGLRYVYIGNYRTPDDRGTATFCPKCGKIVVARIGYETDTAGLKNSLCKSCGAAIAGVWA